MWAVRGTDGTPTPAILLDPEHERHIMITMMRPELSGFFRDPSGGLALAIDYMMVFLAVKIPVGFSITALIAWAVFTRAAQRHVVHPHTGLPMDCGPGNERQQRFAPDLGPSPAIPEGLRTRTTTRAMSAGPLPREPPASDVATTTRRAGLAATAAHARAALAQQAALNRERAAALRDTRRASRSRSPPAASGAAASSAAPRTPDHRAPAPLPPLAPRPWARPSAQPPRAA